MIWRKDLDPAVKAKVKAFFLGYGKGQDAVGERQRKQVGLLSIGGFVAADDDHLLPVREMDANENLEEAKASGDATKVAAAQKEYDSVRAAAAAAKAKRG